jgi:hypothetical protein
VGDLVRLLGYRLALDSVPIDEKDRQWGAAMLKELANGTTIPKVRTAALPPLQETMRLSAPSLRRIQAPERRRRGLLTGAIGVGVGVLLLSAAGYWWSNQSQRTVARADTAAAVAPLPRPGDSSASASAVASDRCGTSGSRSAASARCAPSRWPTASSSWPSASPSTSPPPPWG